MRIGLLWMAAIMITLMLSGAKAQQLTLPAPAYPNRQYVEDDSRRHQLDVFLPDSGSAPYPTILIIHGGGFRFGSKEVVAPIAAYLATQGYAAVIANYRLTTTDPYPAQVEDAFCALAWIHANAATYGFDPARVFVSGESAGGYLAAMLGVVDDPAPYLTACPHTLPESPLRGVIPYYPMSGLGIDEYEPLALGLFYQFLNVEPTDEGFAARYAEASPATYIDGTEPPFLIINGTRDPLLPKSDSALLAAALENAGVSVELSFVDADEHAFIAALNTDAGMQAAQMADAFMRRLGEMQ